jgi:hypothetical protein
MFADEEVDTAALQTIKDELQAKIQKWFVSGEEFDTYVIPADTELFKSFRKPLNQWKFEPIVGPAFFGFNEMTSREYGFAFSYLTNREYRLLAMDSEKTLNYLHNTVAVGRDDIKEAIRRSYGFPLIENEAKYGKGKIQIRDSVGPTDWKVVQFLCSKLGDPILPGVEGYAANFIQEPIPGSRFPPECVICGAPEVRLNTRYSVNEIEGLATPSEFLETIGLKFKPQPPKIMGERKRKTGADSSNLNIGVPKFRLGDDDDNDESKHNGGSRTRRQKKTRRNLKKRRARQTKRKLL